jgi:hypothetical protein
MPYGRWPALMDEYGARRGYPDLPKSFDFEALAGMQGLNIQAMMEGGGGGAQGQASEATHNAPRLSRTQGKSMPDSRSKQASLPGQVSGAKTGSKAGR